MRKVFGLILSLLMVMALSGSVGLVSAGSFNGRVLSLAVTDQSVYGYAAHTETFYANAPSWGYSVNVSYDAAVGSYSGSGCVVILGVNITTSTNDVYTYEFQYCGVLGEVKITSNDPAFNTQTLQVYATNYKSPSNFGIEVSKSSLKFYINGSVKYIYSPSTFSISTLSRIFAGTTTPGVAYKIYIDNVIEKVSNSPYGATEDFDDNQDDYFDTTVGTLSKDVIPAENVPFFSNAGIAAVTLLLVIGAVWFFRRQ